MNRSETGLLFSFVIVTTVTPRLPPGFTENYKERAAIFTGGSVGLSNRAGLPNPSRARNFAVSFIVIEEFHLVIRLRARDRSLFCGTEARSVEGNRQRRFGREHGFKISGADLGASHCEDSEGIPVHVRNSNIVGDHRPVVGDWKPA